MAALSATAGSRVFRLLVLFAMGAALGFMFLTLSAGARRTADATPALSPAEPRPPGIPPSAKWLPESPRYQYARRVAARALEDSSAQLDLSTTRLSREGRYRVSITERGEPVALGEFQAWTLRVTDPAGAPVTGAHLNLGGGMPRHGHGLPSQPRVRGEAAPGEYQVEGLQFSMPGWWELHVYVSKDRREDIATFNLLLE